MHLSTQHSYTMGVTRFQWNPHQQKMDKIVVTQMYKLIEVTTSDQVESSLRVER